MICESDKVSSKIQVLEMADEKYERIFGFQRKKKEDVAKVLPVVALPIKNPETSKDFSPINTSAIKKLMTT